MADAIPAAGMDYRPCVDATTLAGMIASRQLSAREAVLQAQARIEVVNGRLAAFCTLSPGAIEEAEAIDRRLARGEAVGPLAGVPVAVKDLISTRGLRTTYGSPLYADNIPLDDDVVVERLRAAGAIVIGKTNNSEFGYGPVGHNPVFATTRNPWNTDLTPGGSSAGSAAAIAAGVVPLSLGSDGGGSIRIPASLAGVFGFKPSWGRVPLYPGCRDENEPGASGWESLEHIGPITRTVTDAALMLSVLAGPSPRDRHSLPLDGTNWLDLASRPGARLRIAFTPDMGFARVDPQVAGLTLKAAHRLAEALGATLEFAGPAIGDVQSTFETLVAMDTDRAGLRRLAASRGHRFEGALAQILARDWSADDFTAAILARKRIVNAMWRFMDEYDLLLTPSAATAAFPVDLDGPERIAGTDVPASAWTPFSAFANLTGQPAASVPAGFTDEGLPVGLQIAGRHLDDIGVLRAAAALERAMPWAGAWPAMLARG